MVLSLLPLLFAFALSAAAAAADSNQIYIARRRRRAFAARRGRSPAGPTLRGVSPAVVGRFPPCLLPLDPPTLAIINPPSLHLTRRPCQTTTALILLQRHLLPAFSLALVLMLQRSCPCVCSAFVVRPQCTAQRPSKVSLPPILRRPRSLPPPLPLLLRTTGLFCSPPVEIQAAAATRAQRGACRPQTRPPSPLFQCRRHHTPFFCPSSSFIPRAQGIALRGACTAEVPSVDETNASSI